MPYQVPILTITISHSIAHKHKEDLETLVTIDHEGQLDVKCRFDRTVTVSVR